MKRAEPGEAVVLEDEGPGRYSSSVDEVERVGAGVVEERAVVEVDGHHPRRLHREVRVQDAVDRAQDGGEGQRAEAGAGGAVEGLARAPGHDRRRGGRSVRDSV
ncbi:hypothetical protein ACRAWF_05230 [Streptomyces sp. L7]